MKYKIAYDIIPDGVQIDLSGCLINGFESFVYCKTERPATDFQQGSLNARHTAENIPEIISQLLHISGVKSLQYNNSKRWQKISIIKFPREEWNPILREVLKVFENASEQPLVPYKLNSRSKQVKSVSHRKKLQISRQIKKGLSLVKEDQTIFASKDQNGVTCGCVLLIAAAGKNDSLSYMYVEGSINHGKSGTMLLAAILDIPEAYAEKLDNLHRIDKIPALEIARRLRTGEI